MCKGATVKNEPCNLHLTLLQKIDRCAACGWPAGDHPAHPSNRHQPRAQHTSNQQQHQQLADCLSAILFDHCDGVMNVSREYADNMQGTLHLIVTDDEYRLSFRPVLDPPA